jgi:hypothetical protein
MHTFQAWISSRAYSERRPTLHQHNITYTYTFQTSIYTHAHISDMDFLKSIFGETASAPSAMPQADSQEAPSQGSGGRSPMRMPRDDGESREKFRMEFPDETKIDPYDPQTFG